MSDTQCICGMLQTLCAAHHALTSIATCRSGTFTFIRMFAFLIGWLAPAHLRPRQRSSLRPVRQSSPCRFTGVENLVPGRAHLPADILKFGEFLV